MSDTITMRHPTLPKDQEIEVPREAMPHYTAAGWQQVPAEELQKRAALKEKADAEARAAEQAAAESAETADEPEQSEPEEAPTEKPPRSRAKAPEKKGE